MPEQITQATTTTPIPEAPAAIKPKFRLTWTKFIVIISGLLLLSAGGIYLYRKFGPKPITTTGAIITPVTYPPNDPYVELNKLLDLGEVAGDGFSIKNVARSTEVAVFLDKPYDQSQVKFETWLKTNGFENIPKDKIVFFHNP